MKNEIKFDSCFILVIRYFGIVSIWVTFSMIFETQKRMNKNFLIFYFAVVDDGGCKKRSTKKQKMKAQERTKRDVYPSFIIIKI